MLYHQGGAMCKIVEIEGVKVKQEPEGNIILIKSEDLDRSIHIMNSYHIKRVEIFHGTYHLQDIDFFEKCPNVEEVYIDNYDLQDYTGLYSLKDLKILALDETKKDIDLNFEYLSTLQTLYVDWQPKMTGLKFLSNLKKLDIYKFKSKNNDLEDLAGLCQLEELILTYGNMESLKGIEKVKNLKTLQLNYIFRLTNIDAIKFLHELECLEIESCKKIKSFQCIKELKNLNKLLLLKVGDIDSISFVTDLKKLNHFVFHETNVIDGDLSYCEGIEYVFFTQKKHYSHRLKDLNHNRSTP
jgi:hypothetical protein